MVLQFLMRSRCRIVVFILSVIGLLTTLLLLLLRSSPSTLVTIPPPKHQQKVSLILCFPHVTVSQLLTTYKMVKKALSTMELEYEFFLITDFPISTNQIGSHHVVSYHKSCSVSVLEAIEMSHYSVVLLISSNITSYDSTLPKLVKPVLQGESDLVLLEDTRQLPSLWQRFLQILLLPITATTYVPDTLSFAISSSTWNHGCHGVTVRRGSLTVELVSHCFLKHWQLVPAETKPPYDHSSISLSQVFSIWWDKHPFLCVLITIATVFSVLLFIKLRYSQNVYEKLHKSNNYINI